MPTGPEVAGAIAAVREGGGEHACRAYVSHPGKADELLVVFSGHFPEARERGYDAPFEFRRFLAQHPLGLHVLFLRDPDMSWYLGGVEGIGATVEEVAAFIRAEQRDLGASKLYTMGSSMGGYAALLFGHLLKADVVLAFGPQVYLDRAKRRELGVDTYGYEPCLARVEDACRGGPAEKYLRLTSLLPLGAGKAYVHLGQQESSDLEQARGFDGQPNVAFVVWPGGNHMVVKALRDEGKLLGVLRKAFKPPQEPGAAPAGAWEALRERGNALVKAGGYEEALGAYSEALQAGGAGGAAHHLLLANRSLCLLKLGRAEEAWHDADAALCLEPTYTKALYRRAQCEAQRGYVASALRSLARARELDPEDKAIRTLEAELTTRAGADRGGPSADAPFAKYCE